MKILQARITKQLQDSLSSKNDKVSLEALMKTSLKLKYEIDNITEPEEDNL
jgi:hypothetical protein